MKAPVFTLLLAVLFLKPTGLNAQENNVPYLECHYTEKYLRNLQEPDRFTDDEMTLLISKDCSAFYSRWFDYRQQKKDSVFGKGGSLADWQAVESHILFPSSIQGEYIYKNLPERGMLTYTNKLLVFDYKYTTQQTLPQWEILPEQKDIAGYNCQCARTDFGGRTWTAWFATDLPVSDGPWELCGLPGLILEAYDAEGQFHFTCIEINRMSGGKPIEVPKKPYLPCSKEEYIKEVILMNENVGDFLRKRGLEAPRALQSDGSWKEEKLNVKFNYIER